MKWFHAILSSCCAIVSAWLMFFKKDVVVVSPGDMNLILGFGVLLIGIIFIMFMIYEEQKEEVSKLQDVIRYLTKK